MNVLLRNKSKLVEVSCGCERYIKSSRNFDSTKFVPLNAFISGRNHIFKNTFRYYTPSKNVRMLMLPNGYDVNSYHTSEAAGSSTYRFVSTTSIAYNQPSSKVEVTIQNIKNKQKEREKENVKEEAAKNEVTLTPVTESKQIEPAKVKKSLGARVWAEVVHYYHGFRLLVIDINICRKLLWRVLRGKSLNRREHRLLVRTTSDLFRLVPFSIFIIVPFMELLLPFFIKFFPGMLPSTFQTAKEREDKLKQSLQVKLEVAKFLQKTLDEMAVQHKDHKSEEAKEFEQFFHKIKNPNLYVTNTEIIKFSKQFEDEITLDSLTREQLAALCRVLELSTIGTNNFLRFQIRMKLRNLAADDRVIQREGVKSLNLFELQQACRSRGMRAYGLPADKLRTQLQEWIDLNLNEKVPSSLLLLSRALKVPDDTPTTDKLKATISSLPDTLATQTKAAIGEREGKIDNKTKIEIIKEEERKIKEEREEERQVEKEKLRDAAEVLVDKAPILQDIATASTSTAEDGVSSQDVQVLGEALEAIAKDKKKLLIEKEVIKDLKDEIQEYQEDVEELRETTTDAKEQIQETRAAKILYKKVNSMINQLDNVLTDLEEKEKQLRQDSEEQPPEKSEIFAKRQDELLRIDELVDAIKQIQKVSDEFRIGTITKVLGKIDADQDGQVKVDDVLKVIETIGKDNVKLTEKQLGELIDLLDKEEILEAENKIEKALTKSIKEAKQSEHPPQEPQLHIGGDDVKEIIDDDKKHLLPKKTVSLSETVKEEILPKTSTFTPISQNDDILPKTPPIPPSRPSATNSNQKV